MIESFYLYLDTERVYARRRTWLPWPSAIESAGDWCWNPADPLSLNIESLNLKRPAYRTLHVMIGSTLGKFLMLDLPAELADRGEQVIAAAAQMQRRFGLDAADWEVCVSGGSAAEAVIAWAVRRSLIARLHELASSQRISVRSIRPYLTGVWDEFLTDTTRAKAAYSALTLLESGACTTLTARNGRPQSISNIPWRGEADLPAREMRRAGVGEDQGKCYLLSAAMSDSWATQHDYGGTRMQFAIKRRRLWPDFRDLSIAVAERA